MAQVVLKDGSQQDGDEVARVMQELKILLEQRPIWFEFLTNQAKSGGFQFKSGAPGTTYVMNAGLLELDGSLPPLVKSIIAMTVTGSVRSYQLGSPYA